MIYMELLSFSQSGLQPAPLSPSHMLEFLKLFCNWLFSITLLCSTHVLKTQHEELIICKVVICRPESILQNPEQVQKVKEIFVQWGMGRAQLVACWFSIVWDRCSNLGRGSMALTFVPFVLYQFCTAILYMIINLSQSVDASGWTRSIGLDPVWASMDLKRCLAFLPFEKRLQTCNNQSLWLLWYCNRVSLWKIKAPRANI